MRGFSKSTIFLRQDLVVKLVNDQYGGFTQLAADWEKKADDSPDFPRPKQRSSIYRWMSQGVPVKGPENRYKLLALCGLLDVDPLAVLDYEKLGYFSSFTKVRQLVYSTQLVMDSIGPLFELYKPNEHWPSSRLAKMYFGHDWHDSTFSNANEWKEDHYGLLRATFSSNHLERPKAVHIAYRRTRYPDTMWRYYGTVISVGMELRLYSESGAYRIMPAVHDREIRFRTYFGARPVEFKVVSLHEFKLEREWPFDDKDTIGFEW